MHDYYSFWFCCISQANTFIGNESNECLNTEIYKCSISNETDMSNFHRLEVVGRDSETQLEVGEYLNKTTLKIQNII